MGGILDLLDLLPLSSKVFLPERWRGLRRSGYAVLRVRGLYACCGKKQGPLVLEASKEMILFAGFINRSKNAAIIDSLCSFKFAAQLDRITVRHNEREVYDELVSVNSGDRHTLH